MVRRTIAVTMTLAAAVAALVTGLMVSMVSASAQVGYPPGPQPPVVSQTLPAAPPPPARPTSAVAFTGGNILRWALIALVLVAVGVLLVAAQRRRRPVAA